MKRFLLGLVVIFGSITSSYAQVPQTVRVCNGTQPNCPLVGAGNPLPVSGTFSVTGFIPSLSYGTLTATAASSASTALPTNTGTVAFQNQNAVAVSCTLAAGAASATTNEIIVPAGSTIFVGTTGYDHAACINQTGSASNVIVMAGGSGLGTGFGGGSSGSGLSVTDQTAWTNASSAFTPNGGVFNDSATVLTSGNEGTVRLNTHREMHVDVDANVSTNNLYAALTNPPNVTVNGSNSALTGVNPAVAQTGTKIGMNTDLTSIGGTAAVPDPCRTAVKSFLPITATTSLVKVIATGVAAKKIYVCQLVLTTTAANNVAVFEATTGTTCATSPVAVYGAGTSVATAANGFPFPVNGGVSLGGGGYSVAQTTVNNNDLCIGTSAATPLTGGIMYVTQ